MKKVAFGALALCIAAVPGLAQSIPEMQLISAAQDCRAAEAAQLVQRGTNVNARNSGGYTPLMMAAINGCEPVVRLLLEAGADASLRHPSFGDAAEQAGLGQYSGIQELIRGAAAPPAPQPAPSAGGARAPATAPAAPPPVNTAPAAATQSPRGSATWPRIGAYRVGDQLLYSGNGGKTWLRDVVKAVDPVYGYSFVNGPSGMYDSYHVVAPEREPFWTAYFVGDWRVSVPMAMNTVTDGRHVYRVVSGGLRLPPLRINSDGTYTWRVRQGDGERLIRGRWEPRPDAPGVILKNGDQGADWLVYNNSDTKSSLGETVILSSDCCTHYDGVRLQP